MDEVEDLAEVAADPVEGVQYGAVAGPFRALVFALPVGLLRPAEHRPQIVLLMAVSAVAVVVLAVLGLVNGPGAHHVPEGGLYVRR